MTVDFFLKNDTVVVKMNVQEYDVITHAIQLLIWSGISAKESPEKIQSIEDIRKALRDINFNTQ